MRRKKRSPILFVIVIISLASFAYLIFSIPPTYVLQIRNYELGIIFAFFLLLFISVFSLSAYILRNTRRGLCIGLFSSVYLYLRYVQLVHPFFLLLLLVLFITLELFFSSRR